MNRARDMSQELTELAAEIEAYAGDKDQWWLDRWGDLFGDWRAQVMAAAEELGELRAHPFANKAERVECVDEEHSVAVDGPLEEDKPEPAPDEDEDEDEGEWAPGGEAAFLELQSAGTNWHCSASAAPQSIPGIGEQIRWTKNEVLRTTCLS